jgi:tetratricopeptide (TPR) repeat protein
MDPHLQRGHVLFDMRRFREAIDAFTRALAQDPNSVQALAMRGACLLNINRTKQAETDILEAIGLQPTWSFNFYLLSYVRANQGRAKEALAAIYEALRLEHDATNFQRLAEIRSWLGHHEACLDAINQAIALYPRDCSSFNVKAQALIKLGRRHDAAAVLLQALSLEANDAASQKALGQLSLRSGQSKEALGLLTEARRINPVAHNDQDAIASAYGKMSLPFRLIESLGIRFQYWSASMRWLFIMTLCLGVALTLPMALPKPLIALLYLVVFNAAVFPTTFEFTSIAVGSLKHRRELGLSRRSRIGAALRLAYPTMLHAVASAAAIGVVNYPQVGVFLLAIAPNFELFNRAIDESPAVVGDVKADFRVGCSALAMMVVPAFFAALVFHVTQSLPAPLFCMFIAWAASYFIVAYY